MVQMSDATTLNITRSTDLPHAAAVDTFTRPNTSHNAERKCSGNFRYKYQRTNHPIPVAQRLRLTHNCHKRDDMPPVSPQPPPRLAVRGRDTTRQHILCWEFILHLLDNPYYESIIRWTSDSTFCLVDPDIVAQLWGDERNNNKMNAEKLRRVFRQYYRAGIMKKSAGIDEFQFTSHRRIQSPNG